MEAFAVSTTRHRTFVGSNCYIRAAGQTMGSGAAPLICVTEQKPIDVTVLDVEWSFTGDGFLLPVDES